MKNLEVYGWNEHFETAYEECAGERTAPGRVLSEFKGGYRVASPEGEVEAVMAGRVRYHASGRQDLPAVGDWVVLKVRPGEATASIHAVLPRQSRFARKGAGERSDEQVVAANVDTVFLVVGLDEDFNLRRLERYLTLAWESGASPVLVLNKADACTDLDARLAEIATVAIGVPVEVVSAKRDASFEGLDAYLRPGETVALLGSSGVGKSTLANRFVGTEVQQTGAVRTSDGRGRHTTTRRELIVLPSGALLIDTPGMRELGVVGEGAGLERAFGDIEEIARECRFSNCAHGDEPGCAVRKALDEGTLDRDRYENYLTLQREMEYTARRSDARRQQEEKSRWKAIHKSMKKHPKRQR